MQIEAFIITLRRAVERRGQVERLRAACPVACHVVEAVDGNTLSEGERGKVYRRQLHKPRYPFPLNPREIGCFLSHRNAWRRILDDRLDAALILEDDVELEPGFWDAFSFACASIRPGGYLQFQVRPIEKPRSTIHGRFHLYTPAVTPLRASAQLVSRGAAERLVAFTREFDRPVDTLLQMKWLTDVVPAVVVPSCVREVSQALGGSTIQSGASSMRQVLWRELARPVYRASIARLSRKFSKQPRQPLATTPTEEFVR